MTRAISILLLVGLTATSNFAADEDASALRMRMFRSLEASSDTTSGSVERVAVPMRSPKDLRNIEPLPRPFGETPVSEAKAEKEVAAISGASAIGVAQSYYRRGLWESAAEWYRKALDSDPSSILAAEGFIASAFHAGQYGHAYRVSETLAKTLPGMKGQVIETARIEIDQLLEKGRLEDADRFLASFPAEESRLEKSRDRLQFLQSRPALPANPQVIADASRFIDQVEPTEPFPDASTDPVQRAFIKAAEEAYRNDQYETSLWNLEEAEKQGPLTRNAGLLRGWCFYRIGRYGEAADLFEKLYKTQTDIGAARGIVASLREKGDHERLGQLVEKWGGILAGESKAEETTAFDFEVTHVVSKE